MVSEHPKFGLVCFDPSNNCDSKDILVDTFSSQKCSGLILQVRKQDVADRKDQGKDIFDWDCYNSQDGTELLPRGLEQYQLIEIMHVPGKIDFYQHDYSYRPVAALPSGSTENRKKDEWWWHEKYFFEDDYQRMGERAFAGGSNGDVWRARRRCYQLASIPQTQHPHDRGGFTELCDENQSLIMKRLKVGKSYQLLEAGLREVYFGELLSRSSEPNLFTKYIDHFFHRGLQEEDLELWIVYENAGTSMRSLLYTPIDTGDFVVYQHSDLWTDLRTGSHGDSAVILFKNRYSGDHDNYSSSKMRSDGKDIFKVVVKQLLASASKLHERGIVHRDIKPSNIMCKHADFSDINCVLGDLSSGYDGFTSKHLYSRGPSMGEQTDGYAPPEVLFARHWIPFYEEKPETYDSWSIGVTLLEMLLGTPNVFSVDKRTSQLLTNKMLKVGASDEDIRKALYLAALSQFCIYVPTTKSWPLRPGDPLFKANIVKTTCTLKDFHYALRARDPLGIGFDESINPLLQLILGLLSFDPKTRLTATEALYHPYIVGKRESTALEPQMLDPKIDLGMMDATLDEFICPKCGRSFGNLQSCQMHARGRKHAKFCTYDRSKLPQCLNAHSMLPSHPTSGYCDIQGRRKVIEDFHTVHLYESHQFFGVFDGHNGALVAKYASASLYGHVMDSLGDIDANAQKNPEWKDDIQMKLIEAFQILHEGVIDVLESYPVKYMSKSGTTATALLMTKDNVVIASVGDSRAVLSIGSSFDESSTSQSLQLTVDHVASDPTERKRIESLGGFVSERGGTMRVNGTLVLTRSIGDVHLEPYLSRVPNVLVMTKREIQSKCQPRSSDDMPCFIILASDGLWDVFTNQEAVELVTSVLQTYGPQNWKEGGFQEAAKALTQEAFVRGSGDNIGVCVVAI